MQPAAGSATDRSRDTHRLTGVRPGQHACRRQLSVLNFPTSGQDEVAIDFRFIDQPSQARYTRVYLIEDTCRGAFENQAACSATGAIADETRLE